MTSTRDHGDQTASSRAFFYMIAASAAIWLGCFLFRVGLDATPYDTTDSAGRTMGFNDRFSAEHYPIALFNFRISHAFAFDYIYDWILLLMHIAGAVLLHRFLRRPLFLLYFFAAQFVIFPFAILCLVFQPFYVHEILTRAADRESFIDVPFMAVMTQPPWFIVSATIFYLLFRRLRTMTGHAH